MRLFYSPDIDNSSYLLDEEESKHCIRVLRLTEGDVVHLTDGKGTLFTTEIIEANPKACKVVIISEIENYGTRDYFLHLAVAPTKNRDRFEWLLEKITEIGVDEITPVLCTYSERCVLKHNRAEKVLVSAMKQSLKAYLPQFNETIDIKDFIKKPFDGKKFIAHCAPGKKILLPHALTHCNNALVMIGPEGDFSIEEIELALSNGFEAVSLGDTRLRVETAGIVACCQMQTMNSVQGKDQYR
jgi:16S rRNA (uracil1498-N3)-methyltransferase